MQYHSIDLQGLWRLPATRVAASTTLLLEKIRLSRAAVFCACCVHRIRLLIDPKRRQQHTTHLADISRLLHEPLRTVEQELLRNEVFLCQIEKQRTENLSAARLSGYRRRTSLRQEKEYRQLCASDNRSRILACFHFGDYVYGMNYLASLESCSRQLALFSQTQLSEQYFNNVSTSFGNSCLDRKNQLTAADTEVSELWRKLRRGNCTMAMFCDLPPAYGRTTTINFLYRRAQFPIGTALLAVTSATPVLPVISVNRDNRTQIEIGKLIEPALGNEDDAALSAVELTQTLIGFLEERLLRFPHQWRFLRYLPLYFRNEQGGATSR